MKFAILILVLGAVGWGASRMVGSSHAQSDSDDAQTTYYATGQIESKVAFEGGRRQGQAERWHKNGTHMAEGRYENGRMEGAWQFWNADGTPDMGRTGTYHDGERVNEIAAQGRGE